jgi:hypothetical protein
VMIMSILLDQVEWPSRASVRLSDGVATRKGKTHFRRRRG